MEDRPTIRRYRTAQASAYGWRGLRTFHNAEKVAKLLTENHNLDKKQSSNAAKQAIQIRYCLIQAKEYWESSQAVSMATRPLLLYYSCMSLAFAEILWKQGGGSSLDASRAKHGHHGLDLILKEGEGKLAEFSGGLIAKPHISSERRGTFELWHRTARHCHLVGETKRLHPNGHTLGDEIIIIPTKERMGFLPTNGIDLLHCAERIPLVTKQATHLNLQSGLVRATIKRTIDETKKPNGELFEIIVHPGNNDLIELVKGSIECEPSGYPYVTARDLNSGFYANFELGKGGYFDLQLPFGITYSKNQVLLFPNSEYLNEFGYIYVALYLAGMYARYYPEKWMKDIDRQTDISALIEIICEVASERIPLLLLSQLTNSVYIDE